MSDTPFGFSFPNPDDDGDKDSNRGSGKKGGDSAGQGGSGGQGGFGGFPGAEGFDPSKGFDPAALGQMISQFGQMISGMGSTLGTTTGGGGGPVNYELAKHLARGQLDRRSATIPDNAANAVRDASHLAELWLDEATTFPAGADRTVSWSPQTWLDETIDTWKRLCDPVAQQVSGMWTSVFPAEAKDMLGPMMGMLSSVGGAAFGAQLGQALGQLAKEVLTSTDIGIPLGPERTAALLPEAINRFSEGLEVAEREVLVFIAAREAAHVRLFSHVPWLRERLLGAIEQYAHGITIDVSGIEDSVANLDPSVLADPAKLQEIFQAGAFEPKTTPEQKAALERLETLLALIEGWVDTTVTAALGERLPGTAALSEAMRRRRASGGPAEQTFATLVGLELRPRKMREAATLWTRLTEAAGQKRRDEVWGHPDLLPDGDDLDNPAGFIDRIIGGDPDGIDDPIAQLEREWALRAEAEAKMDAAAKAAAERDAAVKDQDATAKDAAPEDSAAKDSAAKDSADDSAGKKSPAPDETTDGNSGPSNPNGTSTD